MQVIWFDETSLILSVEPAQSTACKLRSYNYFEALWAGQSFKELRHANDATREMLKTLMGCWDAVMRLKNCIPTLMCHRVIYEHVMKILLLIFKLTSVILKHNEYWLLERNVKVQVSA